MNAIILLCIASVLCVCVALPILILYVVDKNDTIIIVKLLIIFSPVGNCSNTTQ